MCQANLKASKQEGRSNYSLMNTNIFGGNDTLVLVPGPRDGEVGYVDELPFKILELTLRPAFLAGPEGSDPELVESRVILGCESKELAEGLCEYLSEQARLH